MASIVFAGGMITSNDGASTARYNSGLAIPVRRRVIWLTLFAITMAYLESAVVVYLRQIYYPTGFTFPIVIIMDWVAAVEIGREVTTVIMLLAVGALTGADRWERFLFFCMAFGIWDIFYYAWLWVFLRWPPSLLTWDVLFLIPVPWIGPVLAPLLVATVMVIGSAALLRLKARGAVLRFRGYLWAAAVSGGLIVILSFTLDYRVALEGSVPPPFRWGLFGTGLAMGLASLLLGIRHQVRLLRAGGPTNHLG